MIGRMLPKELRRLGFADPVVSIVRFHCLQLLFRSMFMLTILQPRCLAFWRLYVVQKTAA
jgi:hypothetical protein